MKVKTSITLSQDVRAAMDHWTARGRNRSEFIEAALRAYIAQLIRDEQSARDVEIINRRAEYLNAEAADVLAYQVTL